MSTTSQQQASPTSLLTARQVAERLGVGLQSVYNHVSKGRLRSLTVPGALGRRYRSEEVEALLAARPIVDVASTVTFSARLTPEQATAFRSAAEACNVEPSVLVRKLMLWWLAENRNGYGSKAERG